MPGRFLMKALVARTVNLKDGSILVLNPAHRSDARARFPRVNTQADVDMLEKGEFAKLHTGRAPHFKGFAHQVEPGPTARQLAKDAAPGQRVEAPRRGPRQETDEEAEAAADIIEGGGDDDDGEGTGDPTTAPAA